MDDSPYINDGADTSLRKAVSLLNKIEAKTGAAEITGPVTIDGSSLASETTLASVQGSIESLRSDVANGVSVNSPVPVSDNNGSITVDGSVSVSNLPTIQEITGTVTANTGLNQPLTDTQLRNSPVSVSLAPSSLEALENIQVTFPNSQNVSVQNFPENQTINGVVSVSNMPESIQVSYGNVAVVNLPSVQTVTGPLTDYELRQNPVTVTGPLTNTQLRSSPVSVSGPLTDSQLRASAVVVSQSDSNNLKAKVQITDSTGAVIDYGRTGTPQSVSPDVVSVQGVPSGYPIPVVATSNTFVNGAAVSTSNLFPISLANTASNSNPLRVQAHNGSVVKVRGTTSAVANTSQPAPAPLSSFSANRRYLFFQNISDTDMYINFGATATYDDLLVVKNGGTIVFETTFVPTDSLNVVCSAPSKKYFILTA
jgi:hypothetical protein